MNFDKLQTEYKNAGEDGWSKAAFRSIIRRNYEEIKKMNSDERRQLIKTIDAPKTYITELNSELKVIEYDRLRKNKQEDPS